MSSKTGSKGKKKAREGHGGDQLHSLSNRHPELLQHTNTLFLVFLSGHPEVVFVLHDVC